jgi:Cytochrome P450
MAKCQYNSKSALIVRFTVKLGGSTWVYLNSSRVIRELLDRRGSIYCSKPHTPYLSETLSGGHRMALMEYGPQWRKLRKTMGMFTSMTEVKKFSKAMELESTVMMYEYLQDRDNCFEHHARFANSVVMTVGFGRRTEKGDKLVVIFYLVSNSVIEFDSGAIYPRPRGYATR